MHLKWSDVNIEKKTLQIRNGSTFRTKSGRERSIALCDPGLNVQRSAALRSE
jgi:hypothetical protein